MREKRIHNGNILVRRVNQASQRCLRVQKSRIPVKKSEPEEAAAGA
jgi:hypothetical protein